jgi:hypothetical protein
MCLGCETIEEELAEQEQLDAQVKLRLVPDAELFVDPVAADDRPQP